MKCYFFVLLTVVCVFSSFSNITDSSDLIFNESEVYEYQLDFYIEDWEAQLKKNYEIKEYLPAKFTYGSTVLDSVGVRYKGNSSYKFSQHTPKKPFKIKFDEYKDHTFFSIKKLNFSNSFKDPSFMREMISYGIARKFMPAPRAAYVNLSIEGKLIGLYVQVEQMDKTYLKRYYKKTGNNLYKVGDDGGDLAYLGKDQKEYEKIYELKTNKSENDWSGFIGMIDKLNNTPDKEFVTTMNKSLNLDLCMKNLAFNMVFSHFDSYTGSGRNYYFYDDPTTDQFHMMIWDVNEAFGAFKNNWIVETQDIIAIKNLDKRPLNKRILSNDSLAQCYLRHINTMVTEHFTVDVIGAMADKIKPIIQKHVVADSNKLYTSEFFEENITQEVYLGGSLGSIPGIKSFAKERNENLKKQLVKYLNPIAISPHTSQAFVHGLSLSSYPNPMHSMATIRYSVKTPKTSMTIAVYNSRGERVQLLYKGIRSSGNYHCRWNASTMSPGYYVIKLETDTHTITTKTVLLRK